MLASPAYGLGFPIYTNHTGCMCVRIISKMINEAMKVKDMACTHMHMIVVYS